ncbi:MAG TPA: hypothetical protein VMV02_02195, partial [Acidimicrobiales bacterium]|nr:hypothetical protein [Acidimicrobiales bacterium]
MLGPVGRGPRPSVRRSRRRISAVVAGALLAALVLGEVVAQVVNDATPAASRGSRTWVAAVGPIVEDSTSLAHTLDAARALSGLPACAPVGCQRAAFDETVSTLVTGTAADTAELGAVGLTPPSPSAA